MNIEKIRKLSLKYAQRPCMTPNEYQAKVRKDAANRKLWIARGCPRRKRKQVS